MAHLLPELRDQAAGFRGRRGFVSGGSSVTALWARQSVRIATFAAALGAFLSLVGAFGVDDLPLARRTAYFATFMASGWLLGYAINIWAARQAWAKDRPWLPPLTVAAVTAPIMAVAAWASAPLLSTALPASALPQFVLVAFGMATAMTLLRLVVFRQAPVIRAAPALPTFLARLPLNLRSAELWALQAEDHYLRVHTARGDALILMRLADAMRELGALEGAQTHRSWWVARTAVELAKQIDERAVLTLKNGVDAPVSRRFAPMLRAAGWF